MAERSSFMRYFVLKTQSISAQRCPSFKTFTVLGKARKSEPQVPTWRLVLSFFLIGFIQVSPFRKKSFIQVSVVLSGGLFPYLGASRSSLNLVVWITSHPISWFAAVWNSFSKLFAVLPLFQMWFKGLP